MRCSWCLAELYDDAASCHICGEIVARSYRANEVDGPTEVISFGGGAHWETAAGESSDYRRAERQVTDGRLDVRRELAEISTRFLYPRPTPEIAPRPVGGAPFAALISEALGLQMRPISEVIAVEALDALAPTERPEPVEPPDPPMAIVIAPSTSASASEIPPAIPAMASDPMRSGGRSQAELEGWLDASFERPASEPMPGRPSVPLRGSVPARASIPARPSAPARASVPDRPSAPARPSGPPRGRPSSVPPPPAGPPPVRVESLPLSDPDRSVRRAAELVLACLEAISDNKIGAARNHLKLALGFASDNAAYRQLEDYVVQLDASRDPRVETLERRAAKCESDGAYDKAVDALREALSISEEPQLFERLGLLVAIKMDRPEAGIGFLESALLLRPASKDYKHSYERVKKLVASRKGERAQPNKKKAAGKRARG